MTPNADTHEIPLATVRTFFGGLAGLQEDESGIVPWRLDPKLEPFYHPELLTRALMTAGVHLKFLSQCTSFRLEYDVAACREGIPFQFGLSPLPEFTSEDAEMDVLVNGHKFQPEISSVGEQFTLSLNGLSSGTKEIGIYFPTGGMIRVRRLVLMGDSVATRAPSQPRWITYGSSITHCRRAEGPTSTWPAIVAKRKGWDALNLGFGGQCKFDPVVARVIASMPADRISLCLGINTYSGFFHLRTWVPAVEGFIMTVRDGHPKTPLLIISPILSVPWEKCDEPPATIGLQTMRRSLNEIVAKFSAAGDENIHYLDGLKIIGPGDEHTMPDRLHPDADGIKLMAERFLKFSPTVWRDPLLPPPSAVIRSILTPG